jgi:hypothetical protein
MNLTTELENRLPASLGDMDESYKDDIVCRDAVLATDVPGRLEARLPCESLLRSQSEERFQEDSDGLTSRDLQTARATFAANVSRVIVFCACD